MLRAKTTRHQVYLKGLGERRAEVHYHKLARTATSCRNEDTEDYHHKPGCQVLFSQRMGNRAKEIQIEKTKT